MEASDVKCDRGGIVEKHLGDLLLAARFNPTQPIYEVSTPDSLLQQVRQSFGSAPADLASVTVSGVSKNGEQWSVSFVVEEGWAMHPHVDWNPLELPAEPPACSVMGRLRPKCHPAVDQRPDPVVRLYVPRRGCKYLPVIQVGWRGSPGGADYAGVPYFYSVNPYSDWPIGDE